MESAIPMRIPSWGCGRRAAGRKYSGIVDANNLFASEQPYFMTEGISLAVHTSRNLHDADRMVRRTIVEKHSRSDPSPSRAVVQALTAIIADGKEIERNVHRYARGSHIFCDIACCSLHDLPSARVDTTTGEGQLAIPLSPFEQVKVTVTGEPFHPSASGAGLIDATMSGGALSRFTRCRSACSVSRSPRYELVRAIRNYNNRWGDKKRYRSFHRST